MLAASLLGGGWGRLCTHLCYAYSGGGTILYYTLIYGVGVTLGMALPVIAGYGGEGGPLQYPTLFGMAFFSSLFITPFIGAAVPLESRSILEGWLLTEAAPIAFGVLFGLIGSLGQRGATEQLE